MITVPFFDLGALVARSLDEVEVAIGRVLRSGQFIGGPTVEQFESEFADYLGVRHCIGVANGLDALRLALEANKIGPGDEVIVPAFTFYATLLSVMQTGAIPVSVDVLRDSANIDPLAIEAAITERTRAIVVVHLYGQSADMGTILGIARKHSLSIFEDTAQSHGAASDVGLAGTVGLAGAFSFYPTKNLGALGDAGAVTTSDDGVAAIVRSRRSYGQGATKYDHVDSGWNSRLDPIQAAVLSVHLTHLDEWNTRRRSIASAYLNALGERASAVVGPQDASRSVWHHFVLRAKDRAGLQEHLAFCGVATDVHYPYAAYDLEPVKMHIATSGSVVPHPVADSLSREVTSFPIGPWMTDAQVEAVADALSRVPDELLNA